MPHLAQARKALACDYLCPDKRCWARLNVAVANARKFDPETFPKQESLALLAGIRPGALSRALHPRGKTNGISNQKLKVLAELMRVDSVWLIQGFDQHGKDLWPDWTADDIASGRGTLEAIFLDYLDGHIEGKPTPTLILTIVLGQHSEEPDTAEVDLPEHVGQRCEPTAEIRRYLARNRLTPDAYLARYRPALAACWRDQLEVALQPPPSTKSGLLKHSLLYGMTTNMLPGVIRRRWIQQNFGPQGKFMRPWAEPRAPS